MRQMRNGLVLLAAGLGLVSSSAFADVTISTRATKNMSCVSGVCTPTAKDAILNVDDLTNALDAGNLAVATGHAFGKGAGDIVVEAAFHWASGYGLTLDAFHSIRVEQPVTDAGTGALTLTTNDGGKNGHLDFGAGGSIDFWGLANALAIDGNAYTLVNSVASLAAAIAANPGGNYALAANYDASVDRTYRQDPIATPFNGNFEGLGNAISNVSIRTNDASSEGFFAAIGSTASVSNFRLLKAKLSQTSSQEPYDPAVGVLAAESAGTLYGDEVGGTIVVKYAAAAGGLIGEGGGRITHCTADVDIGSHDSIGAGSAGGLAGIFGPGTILDSSASGTVRTAFPGPYTGAAGGLVGLSVGSIRHSHATGKVSSRGQHNTPVGGLVGVSDDSIFDSYATGNVTGGQMTGGLVGSASGVIARSFATGNVRSTYGFWAGGLVGFVLVGDINDSTPLIRDSYATGSISGAATTGGLMGVQVFGNAMIASSYSTGAVPQNDPGATGGFAGIGCECFTNDDWDITTSGTTNGVGAGNGAGITGLTTAQLQSGLPAGFDPRIWAENAKINRGLPYLIANPPPR